MPVTRLHCVDNGRLTTAKVTYYVLGPDLRKGGQVFKTIYFPQDRTRQNVAARLTISLPNGVTSTLPSDSLQRLREMSSTELRRALGDPYLEDLHDAAQAENRSVSNYCLMLLQGAIQTQAGGGSAEPTQQVLPLGNTATLAPPAGLTFRDSKKRPYHRWYPYVEGFSAEYVRETLRRFAARNVYDPFGGAGTCQLEASMAGLPSFYSEVNPFMRFVTETKVNASLWARANTQHSARVFESFQTELRSRAFTKRARIASLQSYDEAFQDRDYFEERHLRDLLAARDLAIELSEGCEPLRSIMLLAVAANVVRSSNMTRRADLRRRRSDEYKNRLVDVPAFVAERIGQMAADLSELSGPHVETRCVSNDARKPEARSDFDLSLTSPPYLNGTNYCRNTKLEMWLLGWLAAESDLRVLRESAIAAGINNVSRGRQNEHTFENVESIVKALQARDGDRRIPLLVRHYFSDMMSVLEAVFQCLREGGVFVLDIGDSKFYGVHVPTDLLLGEIAQEAGFSVETMRILARRHSYDKSALQQVEIVLRKARTARPRRGREDAQLDLQPPSAGNAPQSTLGRDGATAAIRAFGSELPYKRPPYSRRNWGHPLHSLCSYQGKLKPGIAHWLVSLFTSPGMTVLDPLGGVGTIAFEACCCGRRGVSADLSPLAHSVAAGKIEVPTRSDVRDALARMMTKIRKLPLSVTDRNAAQFGLNGAVDDFYHPRTLEEVLKARRYFREIKNPSNADLFIKACVLHVLHGNRPYALSRQSHPITPFHPRGRFQYKELAKHVNDRAETVLATPLPEGFLRGKAIQADFRELTGYGLGPVDRIITSPPFWGMRFDRPNWLRLWFCGWEAEDFHNRSRLFLERQQIESLDIYRDFFDVCRRLLASEGLMVLHLGGSDKHDMVARLVQLSSEFLSLIDVVSEDVTGVEKHGIRDKGLTTTHNFIFLAKRR